MMYALLLQANTFQVMIATDGQRTFVFFIYGDIEWGDDANIGFNAEDGTRSFMLPGALTSQSINIEDGSNVDVTGLYIYRVDLPSVLGPNDGKKLKLPCVTRKSVHISVKDSVAQKIHVKLVLLVTYTFHLKIGLHSKSAQYILTNIHKLQSDTSDYP